jgi:hypothetical protein
MSTALLGYGSIFEIEDDNSPGLFVPMSEVISITPPSAKLDQIDVTHMTSPNRRREFISGLIDGGEVSFDMNFIPGNTSDDRLFQLLTLPVGSSRSRNLRLSYPNGVTWSFAGELVGYEPTVKHDDKMTATVTFKVSGDVTVGTT